MNTIVLFAVAIALLAGHSSARPQPDEVEDMKKALRDACGSKYPITEESRTNAQKGILSEDRNFKCFIMCTLDEFSLIDEDANIDGETLVSMVPESFKDAIVNSVKSCLPMEEGKPDTCDVSFNFLNCGIKDNPKLVQFLPF